MFVEDSSTIAEWLKQYWEVLLVIVSSIFDYQIVATMTNLTITSNIIVKLKLVFFENQNQNNCYVNCSLAYCSRYGR